MIRKLFRSDAWRQRRGDAAALAGISLFFVAFFPQALFGGNYVIVGDAFYYSYPLRTVAWRMIRHGQLPLWTPYVMSGYPLLSMAQLGLGYPLTWGYLVLPGYVAEQIYVLAPFLLAPVFTYAYLRELGRTPLAALLGALTFGYGGMMASPLANNGLLPNAIMWLPLVLIALERARRRPFVPCLLWATGAYTMSVLTGIGQGFLYVGLLVGAYALFLVFIVDDGERQTLRARLASAQQWRPLFVAAGALVLAMGVAAVQILETERIVGRSIRSVVNYDSFTQGSFKWGELWRSIFEPLFYVIDMHAYVPPVALGLAVVALYAHIRRQKSERDERVFFWLAVAVIAYVLMLGAYTPVYPLVYHLPLLNRFRVPSRHTFEWTFAVGVLAAYGWDLSATVARRWRAARERTTVLTLYAALALLAGSIIVGAVWWLKVHALPPIVPMGTTSGRRVYQFWKGALVLLTLATLWRASLIAPARWRFGVLMVCVLVLCFVEPSLLIARWWGSVHLPASRFAAVSDATRYLEPYSPAENRVYTRVDLMSEQVAARPRFDAANLSAVFGLQNLAGYEPLVLERYSRALGGASLDTVRRLTDNLPDRSLFTERSRVLDILNDTFVVSYANLGLSLGDQSGVPSQATELNVLGEVPPQMTTTLPLPATDADALLVISSLSNSTSEEQGRTVARVRFFTTDGRVLERDLRAGVETAEWAHERPDVRAAIRHKLASVFDSQQVGGATGYKAYRYKTILSLGQMARVNRVEISNVAPTARLALYGAALLDSRTQARIPLTRLYCNSWQPVYDQNSMLILRNTRAQPRAWLVAEAEAVDGEEALRRIRGESPAEFDPAHTALLEVTASQLPPLPGGALAPESRVRLVRYEANSLQLETSAPTATVLVVSEIFYPGWVATVDGRAVPIMLTDYLLRGVSLPAGQHRVEMRYAAPAARNGAVISALTLCVIVGLAVRARRTRTRHTSS